MAVRPASPMVKIYGERNSGTTYLEALLTLNLDIDCLRGGLPKLIRRLLPRSEIARDWYFRATGVAIWAGSTPARRVQNSSHRLERIRLGCSF
jgi:hypothetical protein